MSGKGEGEGREREREKGGRERVQNKQCIICNNAQNTPTAVQSSPSKDSAASARAGNPINFILITASCRAYADCYCFDVDESTVARNFAADNFHLSMSTMRHLCKWTHYVPPKYSLFPIIS